jgi:hypothetical protein
MLPFFLQSPVESHMHCRLLVLLHDVHSPSTRRQKPPKWWGRNSAKFVTKIRRLSFSSSSYASSSSSSISASIRKLQNAWHLWQSPPLATSTAFHTFAYFLNSKAAILNHVHQQKPATATWAQNNAISWYNDPNWRRSESQAPTRAPTPSSRGSSEERVWKWRETRKTTTAYSHLRRQGPIHTWDKKDLFTFEGTQFRFSFTISFVPCKISAKMYLLHKSLTFAVCHVGCWRS